jgi:hypothetical protein
VVTTPTTARRYPWADQGGRPDTALLADFKAMIALRNQHAVLRRAAWPRRCSSTRMPWCCRAAWGSSGPSPRCTTPISRGASA